MMLANLAKSAFFRKAAWKSMSVAEDKLTAIMGQKLPPPAKPLGAYVGAQIFGNQVLTSGQLPFRDGKLVASGKVGREVSEETAMECAKWCAFNCLNAAKAVLGDLDRVEKVLKLNVFVNSAAGYSGQPKVANGASDLLVKVFGEAGKHARAAIGVAELPMNTPVEVDIIFGVKGEKTAQ